MEIIFIINKNKNLCALVQADNRKVNFALQSFILVINAYRVALLHSVVENCQCLRCKVQKHPYHRPDFYSFFKSEIIKIKVFCVIIVNKSVLNRYAFKTAERHFFEIQAKLSIEVEVSSVVRATYSCATCLI